MFSMKRDYGDRIEEIIGHGHFPKALKTYRLAMKEAYRMRPGLHRYVNGSRRFLVHTLAFYLHITRDRGNDTDGLTLKRLRAHCAAAGLASPGMAHLYLQMLRAHRMIAIVEASDRRFRRFEPTEKMIGQVRDHTRAHLAPVEVLFPDLGALAQLDDDPEFVFTLRRVMGRTFFEHGNPIRGFHEINYFAEKASGHMVLLDLMDLATGIGRLPQPRPAKIDFDACSEGCGVSRVHVAKIFAGAESRGLVTIEGPGGSAIRPTPLLIEKYLEWMATQFLFFADCAVETMAKRAAARRRTAPPLHLRDLSLAQ
jgi:hypothetical protein